MECAPNESEWRERNPAAAARCSADRCGALMALRHREVNQGKGQIVDVALYEAVFAMMESMVPEFDVMGFVRERTGNIMPGITPSSIHTCSDGKAVQIGANGDAIFQRFMRAIGRDDLADDPTLADNAGRDARRDELYALIDRWAASLPQELRAFRLTTGNCNV